MKTSKFDPAVEAWIANPEASLARLHADPDGFTADILASYDGSVKSVVPLFNRGVMAIAIFGAGGDRLYASEAFQSTGIETLAQFWQSAIPIRPHSDLRRLDLPQFQAPIIAVEAATRDTELWQLPPAARAAQDEHPESVTLVCVGSTLAATPLRWSCQAHDMTDLEQRIVTASIVHGSVKAAANAVGISYTTARQAIAQVCRDIKAPNLPALVSSIVATAFGALPRDAGSRDWLADILPLSVRQAQIAMLVAEGLSRQHIAKAVNCSIAVVRKELETIFSCLNITSAVELSRLIIECRAVSLLTAATDCSPGLFDPAFEPTRIHARQNGNGRIAWSDYGPRSGKPVLVVHSVWSCRSVPRRLVSALQLKGFRPIAIDRPGFGLTDDDDNTSSSPFDRAIEDVLEILDRERINSLPLISRGAGQFVLELQRRLGPQVERAVLVSPSPPTTNEGRSKGPLGIAKRVFFEHPGLMEPVVRLISSQLTLERMQRLLLSSAKDCPADTALANDECWLRDHYRAIRPFSTGKWSGLLREQAVLSRNYPLQPILDQYDWTILIGARDHLNSPEEVYEFWSRIAPRSRFETIAEGGRFMTASHSDEIVRHLVGNAV